MTRENVSLVASGRTDAGVHALRQIANFKTKTHIPLNGFLNGLNSLLPDDVSILNVEEVPLSFHARKHAKEKEYMYRLVLSPVRLPLLTKRAWILGSRLDLEAMKYASRGLLGCHDFSSFTASGASARTKVRELYVADIVEAECPEYSGFRQVKELRFFFRANGFLKYMVRNMVGFLCDVGLGRVQKDATKDILLKKDRNHPSPTAPPQGLYLIKVFY